MTIWLRMTCMFINPGICSDARQVLKAQVKDVRRTGAVLATIPVHLKKHVWTNTVLLEIPVGSFCHMDIPGTQAAAVWASSMIHWSVHAPCL